MGRNRKQFISIFILLTTEASGFISWRGTRPTAPAEVVGVMEEDAVSGRIRAVLRLARAVALLLLALRSWQLIPAKCSVHHNIIIP